MGLRTRADLRRHWRATVGLTLAVALSGGVVMAAVAGAARTRTALPQFVDEYLAEDFLAYLDAPLAGQSELPARLEEVPGVAAASGSAFVVFASTDDEGRPIPGFDNTIGAAAFVDEAGFRTITRPRLLEGRLASPTAEDEVVINQPFSDSWGVGVGDTLTVVAYEPDQLQAFATDSQVEPSGPRFDLKAVGLVLDPSDVSIQSLPELDSRHLGLTPAFWAAHQDDVASYGVEVSARLDQGADPDEVEQAVVDGIDGVMVERQNGSLPTVDATQRAIELQANALLAIVIVFASVACGLIALERRPTNRGRPARRTPRCRPSAGAAVNSRCRRWPGRSPSPSPARRAPLSWPSPSRPASRSARPARPRSIRVSTWTCWYSASALS